MPEDRKPEGLKELDAVTVLLNYQMLGVLELVRPVLTFALADACTAVLNLEGLQEARVDPGMLRSAYRKLGVAGILRPVLLATQSRLDDAYLVDRQGKTVLAVAVRLGNFPLARQLVRESLREILYHPGMDGFDSIEMEVVHPTTASSKPSEET